MTTARRAAPVEVPGLAARRIAADILENVLRRRRPLDLELEGDAHPGFALLAERDRALTRKLVATVLRRLGTLHHLTGRFLERGFPADAPRVETALLIGAAQILFLDVPDHAAVDLSVRLVQADRRAARFPGLINAVLRRITQEGSALLAELDTTALDTPEWLYRRWCAHYGDAVARKIALAHRHEPALDLTVKSDAEALAQRLRGRVLPTGTVRSTMQGQVALLPGYQEGSWWVQDAAAALPARLLGDVAGKSLAGKSLAGKSVADLCAAPGGKTAQLAFAGADVVAVDRSASRLARVRENLARLSLAAELVVADAAEWQAGPFDAVLVDAPCSSTGTIRRHPDVPWLKHEADIAALAAVQRRLLDRAAALVKPGGRIVYCVCSLEPEEGEQQIAALLARDASLRRIPIAPDEIPGIVPFIVPPGDLRTLPSHWEDEDPRMAGLDGFFAARLQRV